MSVRPPDAITGGATDIGCQGLSIKSGQTHVQKYMAELLQMILHGKLDTTFLISHRLALEDAPKGYKMFNDQKNSVTKVVLKPQGVLRHEPSVAFLTDADPLMRVWAFRNSLGC
jgi:threonine dehydrogenase-like Zn-dependent dehydrogenase